jgi:hypothetical protein
MLETTQLGMPVCAVAITVVLGEFGFALAGRVPFLCLCKEREPKESTPRLSRRRFGGGARVEDVLGDRDRCAPAQRSLDSPSWRIVPCARPPHGASQGAPNAKSNSPSPASGREKRLAVSSAFSRAMRSEPGILSSLGPHRGRSEHRGWPARTAGQGVVGQGCPITPTPKHASNEGIPHSGMRPQGVLSLAYFSLHKQREVSRPAGAKPSLHRTTKRATAKTGTPT